MFGIGWAELLVMFLFLFALPMVGAVSLYVIVKSLAQQQRDVADGPSSRQVRLPPDGARVRRLA